MGSFPQIFRLLESIECIERLTVGYVDLAAQCVLHGNDAAAGRHLQRARDAKAALILISGLRQANNAAPIMADEARDIIETTAKPIISPAVPRLPAPKAKWQMIVRDKGGNVIHDAEFDSAADAQESAAWWVGRAEGRTATYGVIGRANAVTVPHYPDM